MKWTRVLTVLVFGMTMTMFCSAAHAQQNLKIGYMDLSKVFDSYSKTKEFDAELEKAHKQYEDQFNKKMDALNQARGRLAVLKDDEKTKAEADIQKMQKDIQDFAQAGRADLTRQRDEKIREILLEIEKVVSDFAKKQNYDIILNDRVLIYGSEGMDVTDQIIQAINASSSSK